MESLTKEIFGKLFADRGYISSKLFEKVYAKDITLVTRAKKNMKNKLMDTIQTQIMCLMYKQLMVKQKLYF